MEQPRTLWNKFWRDKSGKLVLFETPNPPLLGWIMSGALLIFVPLGHYRRLVGLGGTTFLVIWAYLEIADGTTYARRLLGLVVMTWIVITHLP